MVIQLELKKIFPSLASQTFLVPSTFTTVTNEHKLNFNCDFHSLAVPLSNKHAASMLDYFIKDTNASMILTTPEYEALLKPIAVTNKCPIIIYDHNYATVAVKSEVTKPMDNNFNSDTTAMILYTSGSTGLPKVRYIRISLHFRPE